ncbi:MAG: phenylacetate--CoA ligase family protein [Bacteroidetes bacterium]|nr:MAG: phenylacetate--CoA ligase family protein [Bacteroidota bacterium]RLD55899.1 MAG: phenylacetate--CoA ligase family protein [Bacteroidota bacterium]
MNSKNKHIPEIETRPQQEIRAFQDEKLKDVLAYAGRNSTYYSKVFNNFGVNINKVSGLADLPSLPVTTKDELQRYNDEFICVPGEKIIDMNTTSGTMGDPVTFAMTDKDLDRLAYNEYLSLSCAGATEKDTFQLMTTIDRRFMAGLAYFLGARKLGAGIIRVGNGMPELQWDTIHRLNPTAFIVVPSFLLKLIEYAEANNIDYRKTGVSKAVCIGETLRKPDFSLTTLGEKILEKWDIELYSTYASTEMSTAFTECKHAVGGHQHPELIIVEFLDDDNQPVSEGEAGEVTVTTLGVEGMPLIRFKTGDICHHYTAPCACGRTTTRIGPVIGRKKQMIKFKGTTLYPPALFDILNHIDEVENYVVEVFTNDLGTDEILIRVGSKLSGEAFSSKLKDHFRAKLRVAPSIVFDSVENIEKIRFPEENRKAVNFIDRRTP